MDGFDSTPCMYTEKRISSLAKDISWTYFVHSVSHFIEVVYDIRCHKSFWESMYPTFAVEDKGPSIFRLHKKVKRVVVKSSYQMETYDQELYYPVLTTV